MKTHPPQLPALPSDAAIREKAHELYMRSGWIHGRDQENWLEAKALLTANPPDGAAHSRHRHYGALPADHAAAPGRA